MLKEWVEKRRKCPEADGGNSIVKIHRKIG